MFYAVLIAICAVAVAPGDCDKHTATHWVVGPERQSDLASCFRFGEEYIAQTSLVIAGVTYPKIFCQPMKAEE
jgi:hypothetical protein